jgi:hypothetical protein
VKRWSTGAKGHWGKDLASNRQSFAPAQTLCQQRIIEARYPHHLHTRISPRPKGFNPFATIYGDQIAVQNFKHQRLT